MRHREWSRVVILVCAAGIFSTLTAAGASALTLPVNCNVGETISGAIAKLQLLGPIATAGPNTLNISGTCNENVNINAMANLTLQGSSGATVNGNSSGNGETLFITQSQGITVNNLTINGFGVYCAASTCYLNNDVVQNSGFAGIAVGVSAVMILNTSTVQNNAGPGIAIRIGGNVILAGSTVQGNAGGGITLQAGAQLTTTQQAQGFEVVGPAGSVIQNNGLDGIFADINSSIRIQLATTISGNARDGVRLEGGSKAIITQLTDSGNTGHGIRIGDLSFAEFDGGNSVTGNNAGAATPLDVVCDPQYSATRGIAVERKRDELPCGAAD
jgi:hypothetical protein